MDIPEMMLQIARIKNDLENNYMKNREVAILLTKLEDLSIYLSHYYEVNAFSKKQRRCQSE